MTTTIEQIKSAYTVIERKMRENKAMECIEEFYHDDIIMIDSDQKGGYLTTTGIESVTKHEAGFFACIKAMNEHKLIHMVICNSDLPEYDFVVFATWSFDMDMDFGGGITKYKSDQASTSYWKDGKVAKERFFNPATVFSV